MKSILFSLIVCCSLLMIGCSDDENATFLTIEEFVELNNLSPTTTPSGLQFIIQDVGDEPRPTLNSSITFTYDGYFLGGETFDSQNEFTFPILAGLIPGWQEGLQLIGEGGSITLLIPSNLAYGPQGFGPIPGNTDIGFDVQLISVQ